MRDKVLAARRGGIRHVLLPARNRGDLDELASDADEGLRFTFVETIGDVLFALFPGSGDGVDVPPGASSSEASGDEAGGVRGGRAGFIPVHGHAVSTRAVTGGMRAGRARDLCKGVGVCEAEDVTSTLLESFLYMVARVRMWSISPCVRMWCLAIPRWEIELISRPAQLSPFECGQYQYQYL